MNSGSIGPRRQALLEAWAGLAQATTSGPGFDFSEDNRTRRTRERVDSFLDDPTESRFRALWSHDTLADAVVGGPELVLEGFDDVEAIAARIDEIRDADTYDPSWETEFPLDTAVWELYGRLHPETTPILQRVYPRSRRVGVSSAGVVH